MEWDVRDILLLDLAAILLVIAYLLHRGPRRGGNLRFKKISSEKSLNALTNSLNQTSLGQNRKITVMFNYNGHSWEAFEVLGLPAGAPLTEAEHRFEHLALTSDQQSIPFLVAAVEAIRSSTPKT